MSAFGHGLIWFVVVAAVFAGIIWAILRAKARTYTDNVVRELTEYVKPYPPEVPTPLAPPSRNPSDTTTVAAEKEQLWNRITKNPLAFNQQIEVLVHLVAIAQVDVRFQNIYFALFGSQHRFLQELNLQKGTGTTNRAKTEEFFRLQGEADSNAKAHDFNRWLGFLIDQGFLTVNIDAISLTVSGQDFLVWVLRHQLPTRTYEGV